jgi:hypothetical protein
MSVLLVYPQCPVTFWSFKNALTFIAKKASLPPPCQACCRIIDWSRP